MDFNTYRFSTGGRPVDGGLVRLLYIYAAHDKTCHPLFRRYLQEVVLWDGNVGHDIEKQAKHVDYCLRNWEIHDYYRPGPSFRKILEPYDVYNFLFPFDGIRRELPRPVRIPPEYIPRPAKPREEEQLTDSEDEDSGFGINDQECRKNLGEYPLRTISRTKTIPEPGSLDDYLRFLDEIPRKDTKGKGALRRIPLSAEQIGDDWTKDSKYRGTRQPPLGTRLRTIVNFLCDDDVDRGHNWKRNFDDAVDYLHWLALEDKDKQIKKASFPVQRMFEDAVDKARTHILFEKHHYDPKPLVIAYPPKVPIKPKRLDWLGDATNWPLPTRASAASKVKTLTRRALYPRPVLEPPTSVVNKLPWNYSVSEATDQVGRLEESERNLWNPDAPAPSIFPAPNLSEIEAKAFDETLSLDDTVGWTSRDPATDQPVLPTGQVLNVSNVEHWAKQRGAHRAGLQQILRLYSALTDGNSNGSVKYVPGTPFPVRKPILPNSAVILRNARRKADCWQWIPPRLPPEAMPLVLETMPYTVAIMKLVNRMKKIRTEEYTRLTIKDAKNIYSVALPKNVINGGPFVWRGVPSGTVTIEDLLEQCRTAHKLLQITSDRANRALIGYMLQYVRDAMEGKWPNGETPNGLTLDREEIHTTEEGRQVAAYVNAEDLVWIKFLATEGKSKAWLRNKDGKSEFAEFGVEFENRERYKFYQIFAARVKRVLDDRNPRGMFGMSEFPVSVPNLLNTINAAAEANGHDIFRYEFEPAEACCFLDRMQRFTGLIKFQPSPIGYGTVTRARPACFPEHRVVWPSPDEVTVRARPRYPSHIADWETAFAAEKTMSAETRNKIWDFFLKLGFRLGWTIYAGTKYAESLRKEKPYPIGELRKALELFDKYADRRRLGDNPVADLVMEVDPEATQRLLTEPKPTFQEQQRKKAEKQKKEVEKKGKDKGAEDKGQTRETDQVQDSSSAGASVTTTRKPLTATSSLALAAEKREEKALAWLREKVITEASENLTMLGPGRETIYFDTARRKQRIVGKFDFHWDWAVSGQKQRKQFWSLNRWPIDSGYLPDKANHNVKTQVVHKKLLYNPALADPVDKTLWSIPQAERITLDKDNVKFKPGPARYVRGDTKYQRRKIEKEITRAANRALGLDDQESRPRTWGQTLARIMPFSNPPPPETESEGGDTGDSDGLSLPPVRKEDVPPSWDLEAEKWKELEQLGLRISYSDDEGDQPSGRFDDGESMKGVEKPQPQEGGNLGDMEVPSARQGPNEAAAAAAAAASLSMSGALGRAFDEDSDVSMIDNI